MRMRVVKYDCLLFNMSLSCDDHKNSIFIVPFFMSLKNCVTIACFSYVVYVFPTSHLSFAL